MDGSFQPAPWGKCSICKRDILSSFYVLPSGDGYAVRAHTGCHALAARGLTGDAAAHTAQMAKLDGIARLWAARVTP